LTTVNWNLLQVTYTRVDSMTDIPIFCRTILKTI